MKFNSETDLKRFWWLWLFQSEMSSYSVLSVLVTFDIIQFVIIYSSSGRPIVTVMNRGKPSRLQYTTLKKRF